MKYSKEDFVRDDEQDDVEFYQNERFVSHLDLLALETVEKVIVALIPKKNAVILDLMASWDSHIPPSVKPEQVIGLGLNEKELSENKTLSRYVIHDLNKDPHLPFEDNVFDAVICTVSVDYMTQPVKVFKEIGRILKPGGLNLMIFSNRMFAPKAVHIWRESSERERVWLVEDFFKESGAFDKPKVFTSRGRIRPKDDKYAHLGIPSDPIYAVYARKPGGDRVSDDPIDTIQGDILMDKEVIEQRKTEIKKTLRCPHCDSELKKWEVPQSIFTEWPNDYFYICFNDECPYFVRGWEAMAAQGNHCSYRLMYDPLTDCCQPAPVQTPEALRDGIRE